MSEAPHCFCHGTTAKRETPGTKPAREWCFSLRLGPLSTMWNLWVWREHKAFSAHVEAGLSAWAPSSAVWGELQAMVPRPPCKNNRELVPRGDWRSRTQKADTGQSTTQNSEALKFLTLFILYSESSASWVIWSMFSPLWVEIGEKLQSPGATASLTHLLVPAPSLRRVGHLTFLTSLLIVSSAFLWMS